MERRPCSHSAHKSIENSAMTGTRRFWNPSPIADGLVTAVAPALTDVSASGWLIASNKLHTPATVASGKVITAALTTWNCQKRYQLEVLGISAQGTGGQSRIQWESDATSSSSASEWIDIQYLSAASIQILLGKSLTTLATVTGNNPGGFGVPWNLFVDVAAAYAPAATRRVQVWFNGTRIIDDTTAAKGIGSTGAGTKRLGVFSSWGPTQLWNFDSLRLAYQT
jgi:hypothetical protein